ncbi:MAG TPA: hypothetical protein VEQ58_04710, partial [Polyangiaceae bacterium]|nr:hypothetical protein [Polyangiaceae bacterium]
GQLRLRLIIHSGSLESSRDLNGRSCKDLAGAAAVALAVLLSSEEALDQHDGSGESAGTSGGGAGAAQGSETAAQSKPAPPPASVPAPDAAEPATNTAGGPSRDWHLTLTLPLAAVSVGPERKPRLGLGVAAGASWARWHVRAEAKWWKSRDATTMRLLDEYGAELQRFTVSVRGCRDLVEGRFEVAPCALLSLQHLVAQGHGPNIAAQAPAATWLAVGAGVRARLLVTSWLGLVAGLDAEAQFSRPKINLDGVGMIEQLGPAAATAAIGVEWIL